MAQTDILTCVFALYKTDGHLNLRFCLIWDGRTFKHAFLPYVGRTDIYTCVFALCGTDGQFNMRFCLMWDGRTI